MNNNDVTGTLDTLIIGGGQAGLALGHYLKEQNRKFLILDANPQDRRRLAPAVGLAPGLYARQVRRTPRRAVPGDPLSFPTKDEIAGYLEGYAAHFDLPVLTASASNACGGKADRFIAAANGHRWEAHNVVVATGCSQAPKVPGFAADLGPVHRPAPLQRLPEPQQLQDGPVLVVGLGNSGAEIAIEVSRTHSTIVAGKPTAELPVKHGRTAARFVLPLVRFVGLHVLTLGTPIGRKAAPVFKAHADPLIRTKTKDLAAAGVQLVPRVTGVDDGLPVLADGTRLEVANVIWCTGSTG